MADLFAGASAQNTPTPFNFGTHTVRVVMRGGEPWFVAVDVAEALGYRNAPDAARNLGDHQKASTQIVRSTSGGNPNVTIINESGLYRLVLRSRKPEAEKFSDWVTGEVLPAIRKTGGYSTQPKQLLSQKRWLVTFRDGSEIIQEIDWDACLLKYADLPGLLKSSDNMVSAELLTSIAQACIERLHIKNQGLTDTVRHLRKAQAANLKTT